METAKLFDKIIVNEDLQKAFSKAEKIVGEFLKK